MGFTAEDFHVGDRINIGSGAQTLHTCSAHQFVQGVAETGLYLSCARNVRDVCPEVPVRPAQMVFATYGFLTDTLKRGSKR